MERARARRLREVLIMAGLALVALIGMRIAGVIAPVPIALLVAVVLVSSAGSSIAQDWGPARRVLSLSMRVGVQVVATTLVIYTTGWGPVLSVGYVFCAAQCVANDGSPAVFPATVWSLVCLTIAQVGVALGWIPSVISRGDAAGIAALMAAGLVFVMRILWVSASERETATAGLAHSEERFRRLLVNAADAVVVLDKDSTIVFATEAIHALTGYTVDELVGRRDAGVIVELADLERLRAEHRSVLLEAPGTTMKADMRVRHRAGGLRWCQISVTNRLDDPVIEGIVVNVHDITERREAEASVAVAEARFRSLVQNAADGIVILSSDARCAYTSPSYERMTGHTAAELLGRRMRDFGHPDDLAAVSEAWVRMLEHPDETTRVEARVKHADGRWHWQAMSISNRLDDPSIAGMIVNIRDVTERKALADLLAEESRILEMIAWGEPLEGILDRAASITSQYTGARFCLIRLFDGDTLRLAAAPGFPPEVFEQVAEVGLDANVPSGRAAIEREEVYIDEVGIDSTSASIAELAATLGVVASWSMPIDLPNRNAVAGTLTLLFESGAVDRDVHRPLVERVISVAAVAIEQAQAREELEHRAFHDELTGLPNRALLNDRLTHALQRSPRRDAAVAVVFFDLDRFKLVNDSLGHDAGDRLLVQVAKRLRTKLRASDTVGRLGGDEFVVLVDDIHAESDAHAAVQRVVGILEQPFEVDGETIFVSASVGVALARDVAHAADVLREADDAMYRAKQRGRGSVEYQSTNGTANVVNPLARITALHRALERDELIVHYQPIVDIASRQPISAEALVRWNHPELGLLLPGEFIPLAEDTGLIVPLGWRVLELVLHRLAHRPDLSVSVNVSARQLSEADFVPRLTAMIATIPHGALTLEITESLLIDEPDRIAATLSALADLGVRLSLDDFGTGYSSLAYLSALPIHQLKIDRSFVAGLGERPECETLVSGIIHLGHGLGLEVIAEGVETAPQAKRLLELGCRLAQGYYFGRPQQWSRKNATSERTASERTASERTAITRPRLQLVEPRTA
jgi:diguanylate cyclase (GGDEF)-like protein/PAS domain S-box-containing protein